MVPVSRVQTRMGVCVWSELSRVAANIFDADPNVQRLTWTVMVGPPEAEHQGTPTAKNPRPY